MITITAVLFFVFLFLLLLLVEVAIVVVVAVAMVFMHSDQCGVCIVLVNLKTEFQSLQRGPANNDAHCK